MLTEPTENSAAASRTTPSPAEPAAHAPTMTPPARPGEGIDYGLFLDCVHCGLCTSACPTYLELGNENDSPRGRIYLMRSVTDARQTAADTGSGRAGLDPLVIVDVSVPRNVDPAVAFLEGVELLDMDDLSELAERALDGRRGEVEGARAIVQEEVERYRADERARGAAPIVSALRNRISELREAELERHRNRLGQLDEAQWREVESVVEDVLAKVLHQPTVALKEAAGTARGERLVEALRSLFDL